MKTYIAFAQRLRSIPDMQPLDCDADEAVPTCVARRLADWTGATEVWVMEGDREVYRLSGLALSLAILAAEAQTGAPPAA